MFGAYQAGVWEAISEWFDPDLVVGASVGSLNGYLIACGMPPPELAGRWLAVDTLGEVRWKPSTRCLLDPSGLEGWIQAMCGRATPRREFGVVVTESLRLRPRLFTWPEVRWEHIAASCAVPLFLPAHRIGGVLYSDGGLVDPLPLWAALELGATEIVSVDVMHRRPAAVRAVVGALRRYAGYRRPEAGGVNVIEINPSGTLGGVRESMYWSEANARRWIAMGRKDGAGAKVFHPNGR